MRGTVAGGNATSGTGLGLTIAGMLTGLMGGELTVRFTPGVGSCVAVKLYLPELRARASQRERPGGLRRVGYAGWRRRLLVVDNEEADRWLLIDRLAPLGFELLQAASGEAALALLRSERVDAIFLDLAMPGIDGWTTLRQLRALGLSDAPAAIVSANAFDKGLDNGLAIRPQDFLVKPVRMSELLGWLQHSLTLQWLDAVPDPPDPARRAGPCRWRRALIVDDVPDNLALLHDALDEAGYSVRVATDGPSVIARARQVQPDIVLLDAMMPVMDGRLRGGALAQGRA